MAHYIESKLYQAGQEDGPGNIPEADQGYTGSCDTLDPQRETSRRRKFYYAFAVRTNSNKNFQNYMTKKFGPIFIKYLVFKIGQDVLDIY